jgi:hypothetical protein
MKHPATEMLALYAGGDVSVLEGWRMGAHLRNCPDCRDEVARFRDTSETLRRRAVVLPERLDWNRLAAEMTANIHVGLEAGECVNRSRREPVRLNWRAAAVMAGLSVVVGAAWWINPPVRPVPALRGPQVEMRTTAAGLELNENGNSLVLLYGRGGQAQHPIIVSAPGTLRARYVDADTGQITINNVYSE